jgi:hypothetical protein
MDNDLIYVGTILHAQSKTHLKCLNIKNILNLSSNEIELPEIIKTYVIINHIPIVEKNNIIDFKFIIINVLIKIGRPLLV